METGGNTKSKTGGNRWKPTNNLKVKPVETGGNRWMGCGDIFCQTWMPLCFLFPILRMGCWFYESARLVYLCNPWTLMPWTQHPKQCKVKCLTIAIHIILPASHWWKGKWHLHQTINLINMRHGWPSKTGGNRWKIMRGFYKGRCRKMLGSELRPYTSSSIWSWSASLSLASLSGLFYLLLFALIFVWLVFALLLLASSGISLEELALEGWIGSSIGASQTSTTL